jgi:cyclin-dependent kinase 7
VFVQTGDSDVEQLGKIFNLLGTPTVENWPKAELLPNYIEFEPRLPRRDFKTLFSDRRAAEYDLLMSLLQLDPARRPTATEVRSVLILLSDHSSVVGSCCMRSESRSRLTV